jgi:hypothetical protein
MGWRYKRRDRWGIGGVAVLWLDFEACDEAAVYTVVDWAWSFFDELDPGQPPESARRRRSLGIRAPRRGWRLAVNRGGGVGGSEPTRRRRRGQW